MNAYLYASVIVLLSAARGTATGADGVEIVILGTLHGAHNDNPEYTPAELRRILLELRPAAILTESPESFVNERGRIPQSVYGDSPDAVESPIENEVADSLDIRLYPFDRADRQENFQRTNYFERERTAGQAFMQWYQDTAAQDSASADFKVVQAGSGIEEAQALLTRQGAARVINSPIYDGIIRSKKTFQHEVMPAIFDCYPESAEVASFLRFHHEQWLERNSIMARNILRIAAEFPGERIVVVTGGEHRYILRDMLIGEEGVRLKEFWEVLDVDADR